MTAAEGHSPDDPGESAWEVSLRHRPYVGHTPLVRLRRLSELTGCEILGKAEFMNPGGSVKDRPAFNIIAEAEASGRVAVRVKPSWKAPQAIPALA